MKKETKVYLDETELEVLRKAKLLISSMSAKLENEHEKTKILDDIKYKLEDIIRTKEV